MKRSYFRGLSLATFILSSAIVFADGAPQATGLDALLGQLQQQTNNMKNAKASECAVAIEELSIPTGPKLDDKQQKIADQMVSTAMATFGDGKYLNQTYASIAKLARGFTNVSSSSGVTASKLLDTSLGELQMTKQGSEIRDIMRDVADKLILIVPPKDLGKMGQVKLFMKGLPIAGRFVKGIEDWKANQQPIREGINKSLGNFEKIIDSYQRNLEALKGELPGIEAAKVLIAQRREIIEVVIAQIENKIEQMGTSQAEEAKQLQQIVLNQFLEAREALNMLYLVEADALARSMQHLLMGTRTIQFNRLRLQVALRTFSGAARDAVLNNSYASVNEGGDHLQAAYEGMMVTNAQHMKDNQEKMHDSLRKGPLDIEVVEQVQNLLQETVDAADAFQAEYHDILTGRNDRIQAAIKNVNDFTKKMDKRLQLQQTVTDQAGIETLYGSTGISKKK